SLEAIAQALIEYETIEGDDIDTLMGGGTITREPPKVRMTTREEIEQRRKVEEERKKAEKALGGMLDPKPSKA
ncbi:MAG: hypothetical protein AAFY60_17895, partial [Myxococcota bacterium]